MQEIKSIKKISLANIAGLIYASLGFLFSLGFSFYSLIKFALGKNIDKTFFVWFFTNIGLNILISLAVAAGLGIFGWIFGIILAFLYNFFAREIGGIKIELKEEVANLENKESAFAEATADKTKQELFKY